HQRGEHGRLEHVGRVSVGVEVKAVRGDIAPLVHVDVGVPERRIAQRGRAYRDDEERRKEPADCRARTHRGIIHGALHGHDARVQMRAVLRTSNGSTGALALIALALAALSGLAGAAPTPRFGATPTSGAAPLQVGFDTGNTTVEGSVAEHLLLLGN